MPDIVCSYSGDDRSGSGNYLFIRKCKPPRILSVITVVFIIVSEGNLILLPQFLRRAQSFYEFNW